MEGSFALPIAGWPTAQTILAALTHAGLDVQCSFDLRAAELGEAAPDGASPCDARSPARLTVFMIYPPQGRPFSLTAQCGRSGTRVWFESAEADRPWTSVARTALINLAGDDACDPEATPDDAPCNRLSRATGADEAPDESSRPAEGATR